LLAGDKSINDRKFKGVIMQTSKHVTDLFWYPRIEDGKLLGPNSKEWQAIKAKKYSQAAMPRDNDVEKLYQVGGRHLVVVFNCFKGFGEFNVGKQEDITNGFLENVVEKQGWEEEKVNWEEFDAGIKSKAVLGYSSKSFYVISSEKQKEIVKANQSSISRS
jgi:hypothetical protein